MNIFEVLADNLNPCSDRHMRRVPQQRRGDDEQTPALTALQRAYDAQYTAEASARAQPPAAASPPKVVAPTLQNLRSSDVVRTTGVAEKASDASSYYTSYSYSVGEVPPAAAAPAAAPAAASPKGVPKYGVFTPAAQLEGAPRIAEEAADDEYYEEYYTDADEAATKPAK